MFGARVALGTPAARLAGIGATGDRTDPARGVHHSLLSLPPKLQEGFDQLRIDAEKVSAGVCALLPANDQGQLSSTGQKASEVASNAAALADMLIATNTVHSFQLGDGDRQVRILPRGPCGSHTRSKHGRTSSGC